MRYRTNSPLSILGSRVETGTEVELTEEQAARFDAADLTLVASIEVPEPGVEEAPVAIEDMSLAQLKERAAELGLAVSGSKSDLTERISLHLASTEGSEPEDDAGEEGSEGSEPEGDISNANDNDHA